MKEKIKAAWTYAKEHPVKILVISGVVVIGGISIIKALNQKPMVSVETVNLTVSDGATNNRMVKGLPDLGVGVVGSFDVYGGGTKELMVEDLSISDLGKLGEGIINNIPNVSEHDKIWAMIDIYR